MGDMQVIETAYSGVRFRSRTEARWAVFFDKIGIPWSYEDEAYVVDGQPYLPDFWLPSVRTYSNEERGVFFEVKGAQSYGNKPESLARASGRDVFVAVGTLLDGEIEKWFGNIGGWDAPYSWDLCCHCHEWTIHFQDHTERHCGIAFDKCRGRGVQPLGALEYAAKYRFWNPS